MFDGIIINPDNSYELLKIVDGKLSSIHLSKDGLSKSNHQEVQKVLDQLLINHNCSFMKKAREFDLYYDKNNRYYHFLQNNHENFDMFFKYNGEDCLLCEEKSPNKKRKSKKKSHKVFKTFGVLTSTVIISITAIKLYDFYHSTADLDKSIDSIYSTSLIEEMYKDDIDFEEAIDLINNTSINITDEQKIILLNRDFLEDVFRYYQGSAMPYLARLKFNNIEIKDFDEEIKKANPNITGYYMTGVADEMNIIHLSNEANSHALFHEFVHLASAINPYKYFDETVAELMTCEYYDGRILAYSEGVNNLKLLIDIIGPEPILNIVFKGDDTDFLNTIKANLNKAQSDLFIATIHQKPQESTNYIINKLLAELYNNINKQDIVKSDTMRLMTKYVYPNPKSGKGYLNPRKMKEMDTFEIYANEVDEYIFDPNPVKDYIKYFSYSDYLELKDSENFMFINNVDLKYKYGFILDKPDDTQKYYLLKFPIEQVDYESDSIIDDQRLLNKPGSEISIEDALQKNYVRAILRKNSSEITDLSEWTLLGLTLKVKSGNKNIEVYYEGGKHTFIVFKAEGLTAKFPSQYERLTNNSYNNNWQRKVVKS